MEQILDTVKSTMLYVFKQISTVILSATSSYRNFPEDLTSQSDWGRYVVFPVIVFIIPIIVGLFLSFLMDGGVFYLIKCFKKERWSARNGNCYCSIMSEFFQIFVFLFSCATVGLMCFAYFGLTEMKQHTINLATLTMNQTAVELGDGKVLNSSNLEFYIILLLVLISVIFCAYAIIAVIQIFSGYYCFCGEKPWYIYISIVTAYIGVLVYTILCGLSFGVYFTWDDFCRDEYRYPSLWQFPDLLDTVPTYEGNFTRGMLSGCFSAPAGDNPPILSNESNCQTIFERFDLLVCEDINYFLNGGVGLMAFLTALTFFGLFWTVSYNSLLIRAKNIEVKENLDDPLERLEQEEPQPYYFDDNDDLEFDYYEDE